MYRRLSSAYRINAYIRYPTTLLFIFSLCWQLSQNQLWWLHSNRSVFVSLVRIPEITEYSRSFTQLKTASAFADSIPPCANKATTRSRTMFCWWNRISWICMGKTELRARYWQNLWNKPINIQDEDTVVLRPPRCTHCERVSIKHVSFQHPKWPDNKYWIVD